MPIGKIKLYTILLVACAAGYIWLLLNVTKGFAEKNTVGVCLIKQTTNIPCPSCGSTRAVLHLLRGDFLQSVKINPFGIIISTIMLITPIWIIGDFIARKSTLLEFYIKTESLLKKPGIAIPLILLVVINWIWNITKGI